MKIMTFILKIPAEDKEKFKEREILTGERRFKHSERILEESIIHYMEWCLSTP